MVADPRKPQDNAGQSIKTALIFHQEELMISLDIPEVLILILLFAFCSLAVHQYRYFRHHHHR